MKIICLVLIICLLPINVFAAGDDYIKNVLDKIDKYKYTQEELKMMHRKLLLDAGTIGVSAVGILLLLKPGKSKAKLNLYSKILRQLCKH